MSEPRSSDAIKAWAWGYRGPTGRKFVLVALCQWVTPSGEIHNLTVRHLAELVGLHEMRVRNHLRRLIAEGMVERAQDRATVDGRFAICRYQLRAPWLIEQEAGALNCQRCRAPLAPAEVGLCKGCARLREITPIA